jgi:hypothetical protein
MTSEHQRIEDIATALAAYENATTLAGRITDYCAAEQMMNTEYANHRAAEGDRIHRELVRIGKDTRVQDALDAKSPFSKANWAKAKAARTLPATQTQAA